MARSAGARARMIWPLIASTGILLCAPAKALSQNSTILFEHFSDLQSFSAPYLTCIYQDRAGYLWFGTLNGLDRYDGYSLVSYVHDRGDSSTITNAWVSTLFEDRAGNFWVGTADGLDWLDRETGKFTHCFPDSLHVSVQIIYEDRSGTIWVGTSHGLYKVDVAPSLFTHYNPDPSALGVQRGVEVVPGNSIRAICEDSAGVLWIGTGNGVYGLNRATGEFQGFRHDDEAPGSLSHNAVNTIYEDSEGVLWFGTGSGVDRLDRGSKEFVHYWCQPGNPVGNTGSAIHTILSIHEDRWGIFWFCTNGGVVAFDRKAGTFTPYLSGGPARSLVEDERGVIWVGTEAPDGLHAFDRSSKTFSHYTHDAQNPGSLSNGGVQCVYHDRSGTLWISTTNYRGGSVDKVNWPKPLFSRYVHVEAKPGGLSSDDVGDVVADDEGAVWMATLKGLEKFDPAKGTFKRYAPFEPARVVTKDLEGALWIGTRAGGLYKRDRQGRVTRCRDVSGKDWNFEVIRICEARDGSLWLGTKDGLFVVDPLTNVIRSVDLINRQVSGWINGVFEDASGLLWLGPGQQGLLCFDPLRNILRRFNSDPKDPGTIGSNTVITIHEDKTGRFWLGTGLGLGRYDRSSGRFEHFTKRDGLAHDVVYTILEDDRGALWIGTLRGISRFDPGTRHFKNYEVSSGLTENELQGGCRTGNGEMYFSGRRGLVRFHPDSLRDNPFIPPIVITRFTVFDNPTPIARAGYLSHQENTIGFEFAALSYISPEKNQYAYQMEGIDSGWVMAGTRRYAGYPNLAPGEYVFRVKGSNNDGVWNEAGTSVAISIAPPFWKTWWAYACYALFALGLLYSIRRYEMNRQQLRFDYEKKNIESARLRELDGLKSRFFANISHEFRTPLTLILGPVAELQAVQPDDASRRKLSMMERNAHRLLRLINQLLDLSKLEAGGMKLQAAPGNIISFVRGIAQSFQSSSERKSIKLTVEVEEEKIGLYFDRDKMEKILTNVIANAFKFTQTGGEVKVVILRSEVAPHPLLPGETGGDAPSVEQVRSDSVTISVTDTGIGIPEEEIPHVFDRFYQVDNSHTREQEGSGIGLALTKELVELHHGDIRVKSQVGKGTEIVVRLPLGLDHFRPEEVVEQSLETGQPGPAERIPLLFEPEQSVPNDSDGRPDESPLILLVEDNADVRTYLREHLRSEYRLLEASNGAEGIEAARDQIPDLVISDVMMPKIDGYELCKTLKLDEKTSHIPVILLTAKAGMESKLEGLETGADDYLTKPFEAKELLARVKNLIELRRKLRERFVVGHVLKPGEVAVTSVDDAFLRKVMSIVEERMGDEYFSVEDLARTATMSRSQLHRKLTALTNQSPTAFIRSMRLHRAMEMLKKNAGTVSEVAYAVGFGGVSYFSKCFQDQFGILPSDVRNP